MMMLMLAGQMTADGHELMPRKRRRRTDGRPDMSDTRQTVNMPTLITSNTSRVARSGLAGPSFPLPAARRKRRGRIDSCTRGYWQRPTMPPLGESRNATCRNHGCPDGAILCVVGELEIAVGDAKIFGNAAQVWRKRSADRRQRTSEGSFKRGTSPQKISIYRDN
jgi:hypothetical protein